MYEQLHKSILEHVTLREDDWEICKSYLRPKQVKKRQYLFREGELCRELIFVERGALYSFSLDDSGNKHVIAFAFEGWWISNLQSFLTGKRSRLFIEVLEDSNILMLNRENHEKLMEMIPTYERYHRIILQNAYVALQRRVENAIGLTAEEKYARLITESPAFLNRVPQHLIASYIGVSPETLSRVRRNYIG